jgi:hypothetical protein
MTKKTEKNKTKETLDKIITIYKKYNKSNKKTSSEKTLDNIFKLLKKESNKKENKLKKCIHCLKKSKCPDSICKNCQEIPRCKKCNIIMGYWNEDKTLLIYNNDNKPSILFPEICQSCVKKK